ncbi:MAG: restriction endonuclease subunit S [Bacilli bacterium]|nr:restriction endonuclease subunit S [Bacilli bacterium]
MRFDGFTSQLQQSSFGKVAEYKKGPFGSALKKEIFVPKGNGSVKIYEQQNAINKDWRLERYFVTKDYAYKLKGFEVKGGDILVSCAGTVGELYTLPTEAETGLINQALMRIRVHDDVNQIWFCYAFNNMIKQFSNKYSNGSAIKNIPPFADLKSCCLMLPSFSEQKKIVDFLSKIDLRIETQNKIIDNLKSQIKSISSRVYKLFSKISKLSELISFEKKTNHKSEEGLKEGRYPFYTNEENQNKFFNSYDFDGLFILSNTGGRANFKIVNGKFAVMSDTLVIKFKNPFLARTYINFLQNNTEKISHDIFAGSGLKHLDKNAFLNMNVPLVDKNLSIINKLFETLDNKLINEKKYLSLLIMQKQYLLNNLFI